MLNKSINLAVSIGRNGEEGNKLAIVQVPAVLDRFIKLPNGEQHDCFILLEEVISHFIHKLFKGYVVRSVSEFRITRNADLIIHEEGARDLLKEIENELKKQKWGEAIRLEITQNMDKDILRYLLNVLEIHKNDVYIVNGPLDLTFLFKFYGKLADEKEHLIYESYIPRMPEALMGNDTIFEVLSKKDILLHHPYDSFAPVIDFIVQAAEDPYVLAIKQTLYRVSGDSQIIEALKRAAENGKQVTVLVELKARFDEENNVQWARTLERAGCHVIYGVNNLKTHSKITLVVRQKEGKIERFVHLGTGNYNDVTAKIYTDMGLLTSNPKFGIDATDFFNYLSGYLEKPPFHHISTSPFDIREDLIQLIDREIDFHKKSGNGRIIAQMNSITDKSLIMKLYEASQAGVEIDLIVRGICCLRPGIKGVSETVRVRSIVGRFLEHKRIYYFYHDGKEQTYLSSADLMTRNMENRVEILFPICAPYLKQYVKRILDIILDDNVKARQQDHCG
jgi:polyphosphate kinase